MVARVETGLAGENAGVDPRPATVGEDAGEAGGADRLGEGDRRGTRLPIEAPMLGTLFETAAVGIYATDADGLVTGCNPHMERLLGYREEDLVGRDVHGLVHRRPDGSKPQADECALLAVIRDARAADGRGDQFTRSDGSLLPVAWSAAPVLLAGTVTGSVVVFRDDMARDSEGESRTAEHTALNVTHERLSLLADATSVLTATLDLGEALHRLASITVPRLADWSVVDLLTDSGEVQRAALAHRDPEQHILPPEGPIGMLPPSGEPGRASVLARVLHGAEPVLVSDFPPPHTAEDPLHRAQLDAFEQLGAASAIVAPLRARDRVLGALTVARTDPTRPYGAADVALVYDLAGRAGLAADNARLYGQQLQTADALQRSLLPVLPSTRHLGLAARYRPARENAHTGGDWYDAFRLLDGRLALVIGDVVGHGLDAAVRMGELRNLLRGIAITTGVPPALVLAHFDRAVIHLATDSATADLASAVYAIVEGEPAGPRRLVWSNAGHPPPLLLNLAGSSRFLDEPSGLLIGVDNQDRANGDVPLPPGATLLLYTDGLVETRTRSLDDGLDRLRRHAGALIDQPLGDLCDQLLDRLAPTPTDDVAILAARIG